MRSGYLRAVSGHPGEVMCWVAAARGANLAEERGDDKRAQQWRAGAEKIKAEVLDKGVSSQGMHWLVLGPDAIVHASVARPATQSAQGARVPGR